MSDSFQYLDILLFAAIAGFLIVRLWSVLGRRTGHERPRDTVLPPRAPLDSRPAPASDPVAALPPRSVVVPADADGLARLKSADRSFDERAFLNGARAAFEIIVNAFAKGDTAALQPLLSESVYKSFADAIEERLAQRETLQTNLISIKSVGIAGAELEGETAFVTVKFVSDQTNVTRASDGSIVDGSPDQVIEKTDLWTFARTIRSRDPNWTLVASHSA
jgi:predicted lipid-binding transport protein (Tim44 family)